MIITDSSDVAHTVADSTDTTSTQINNKTLGCNLTMESRRLGLFYLELINDSGEFLNTFEGGDVINIYSDYTDATTEIFRGKVDEVSYSVSESEGYTVNITGKDYPEASGLKITEQFLAPDTVWTGFSRLTSNYITDVTVTYWENDAWTSSPSTTFNILSKNYSGETVEEAIEDMAIIGDVEAYFEYDSGQWYLRVFDSVDKVSTENSVQIGTNLISVSDFGKNYESYANRVKVTGKLESDNITLIKTEETTPEGNMWRKEHWVGDTTLDTMDMVQTRANNVLTNKSSYDYTGDVSSLGLATLKPGFSIPISVPYCGINGNYKVTRYTHDFTSGFTTRSEINRITKTLRVFFNTAEAIQRGLSPSTNLNNMRDSYVAFFDETTPLFNHVNTEETDGVLRLTTGQSTGVATSLTYDTDIKFTTVEFRIYANFPNTEADTYEISNDDGTNWTTVTPGVETSLSTADNRLKIRMNLTTNGGLQNPAYESICLLYKA